MMSFLNTNRMDDLSQRENRYLSFSTRLASSNATHHRIPSQEDVQDHNAIDTFDNEIPDGQRKASNKRPTRLTQHQFDGRPGDFENEIPDDQQEPDNKLFTGVGQRESGTASGSSRTSLRHRSRLRALIWPAVI